MFPRALEGRDRTFRAALTQTRILNPIRAGAGGPAPQPPPLQPPHKHGASKLLERREDPFRGDLATAGCCVVPTRPLRLEGQCRDHWRNVTRVAEGRRGVCVSVVSFLVLTEAPWPQPGRSLSVAKARGRGCWGCWVALVAAL